MKKWREYKIEDIAELHNNKRVPLSSMQRSKKQGVYPYYGASGIVDHIDSYAFDGEYVLISEDGENLKTRKTPIAFKASGKFWVNNHAHIVKGKKDFHNNLITYYFANLDLNEYITGAVQPKLNKSALTSIPFYLPEDEDEQKAIASVLSSLDDKIDLLHRQNKTLEAMAETLFRQWFVEEARADWPSGKVSDLIDVLSGFAFKSTSFVESGTYRLMTIKAVQDGFLEKNNADRIADIPVNMPDYCHLQEGDILLSLTGNVGRCCLVDDQKLLLNQRVAKLRPKNERDRAFAYVMFRQTGMRVLLEEMAKGTAQANLSPVEMANMEIQIPSDDTLLKFSLTTTPILSKILFSKREIKLLENLRDDLLPKLMSGDVRVV